MKSDTALLQEIREYGYDIYTERKSRLIDRGGGVAAIFKRNLKCKLLKFDKYSSFEFLVLQVITDTGKICFTNIYYPGYSDKHKHTHNMFFSDLEDLFERLLSIEGKHIILGDFNVHMEDEDRPECRKFKCIIRNYELFQHVVVPTHRNGGILDLFICGKNDSNIIESLQVSKHCGLSEISDHNPICVDLHCALNLDEPKITVKSQNFGDREIISIREKIENSTDLINLENVSSIEEKMIIFNAVLNNICNEVSPIIVKNVRPRPKQRWFNGELREMKRVKRRAERKWLKSRSSRDLEQYKLSMDLYYAKIKVVRTDYYKDALSSNSHDLKETFNVVNRLAGQDRVKVLPSHTSEVSLAENFAKFFDEKIKSIRKGIQEELVSIGCSEINENSYNGASNEIVSTDHFGEFSMLDAASVHEMFVAVNKKYCSIDPMPINAIAKCSDLLEPYFLDIINMSLNSGVFPDSLKHAIISPVLKDPSLDPEVLKHYRPISNTPFIAKLIEKTVLLQLNDHLRTKKLCTITQSAYKEGHSCETALLDLVNGVQSCIYQGEISVILMLDLSSAFDTIDHMILLDRLRRRFQISGVPLRWITSFLRSRTFSVKVGEAYSSRLPLVQGVPQGSILGPLLFILYIDEISLIALKHGVKVHVYADDTTFYIGFRPADEFSTTLDIIQQCIEEVKLWMLRNFLKLNLDKTQVLFCGKSSLIELYSSRFKQYEPVLGTSLGDNLNARVLGVRLDQCLKFDDMIGDVCKSGYFRLNKLKAIRNSLDVHLKVTLVRCYVLSSIDYCSILYANINGSQMKRLQRLMNTSVRFIYGLRKSERITPFMKQCHFLPVKYRILFKLCVFVFRVLHGLSPEYLQNIIYIRNPLRAGLRSSAADRYIDTDYRGRTIAVRMVEEWNVLPGNLRRMSNLENFKGKLKTHFFAVAYG